MRWPFRQNRLSLLKGLPALCTDVVTPFTLTVPQAFVVTCDGFNVTWDESLWPLAPAPVPGKNTANVAMAATARRPAGRRTWVRNALVRSGPTPRIPT